MPGGLRRTRRRGDGGENDAQALERFTVELVELARRHPERHFSGRREESEAVMRTLLRADKCCQILVGRPGVGKTAVVELLAQRIAAGDVPEPMKKAKIYSLSSGSLIAGASFRGQYEGRLRAVVDAVKRQPRPLSGLNPVAYSDRIVYNIHHQLKGADGCAREWKPA